MEVVRIVKVPSSDSKDLLRRSGRSLMGMPSLYQVMMASLSLATQLNLASAPSRDVSFIGGISNRLPPETRCRLFRLIV